MTLAALRDDALSSTTDGFALRLSLPWIRSLPARQPRRRRGRRRRRARRRDHGSRSPTASSIPPRSPEERAWWFLQDRVVLRGARMLRPGAHDVAVSFRLVIPYLQVGPDGPLTLPFRIDRSLRARCPGVSPVRLP